MHAWHPGAPKGGRSSAPNPARRFGFSPPYPLGTITVRAIIEDLDDKAWEAYPSACRTSYSLGQSARWPETTVRDLHLLAAGVRPATKGMPLNSVVGIVGAFLGGRLLAPFFGTGTINQGDFTFSSLIVSLLGAVILLFIVGLFRRRRHT